MAGIGTLFRAAGWGLGMASRLPGMAAIGVGAHYATDGRSTDAVLEQGGNLARSAFTGATGIDTENINNLMEDFSEGDWKAIMENPMLSGAAGLAAFAMSTAFGGRGIINSVVTGLLVAGAAYVAQKHLLPTLFADQAENPDAPAPRLTTPAPAQTTAPAFEAPEP